MSLCGASAEEVEAVLRWSFRKTVVAAHKAGTLSPEFAFLLEPGADCWVQGYLVGPLVSVGNP